MKRYTLEQIRKWMAAYGAPEWLKDHLTEEKLDHLNPEMKKVDPNTWEYKERIDDMEPLFRFFRD